VGFVNCFGGMMMKMEEGGLGMGTVRNILFSWACDAITKPQFQQRTPSKLCIQDAQLCNILLLSPKSPCRFMPLT